MKTYRLEFLPIAEDEVDDAVNYYATLKTNLSAEFILDLDTQLNYLSENPKLFAKVKEEMRKAPLKRFPYNIIYEILEPDVILILAIAHQKQNPSRWINR